MRARVLFTFAALSLSLVSLFFGGCAGYRIEEGGTGAGYDVYAPEPYLKGDPVVLDTAEGKVVTYRFEVVWLPNYSKRYRVRSWSGMGKAEFQFTFAEGWKLTGITDKTDHSSVVTDLTNLVRGVLPADPFASRATTPKGAAAALPLRPVLYRIDFDADGRPACLRALSTLDLPCPPPCATR